MEELTPQQIQQMLMVLWRWMRTEAPELAQPLTDIPEHRWSQQLIEARIAMLEAELARVKAALMRL